MKPHRIVDMHFDHKVWRNEIAFFRDELKIFKSRLEEVVKNYTDSGILAQCESFQNKFIRQDEILDELEHEVNIHETAVTKEAAYRQNYIDQLHSDEHMELSEKMKREKNIITNTKNDFYQFISGLM